MRLKKWDVEWSGEGLRYRWSMGRENCSEQQISTVESSQGSGKRYAWPVPSSLLLWIHRIYSASTSRRHRTELEMSTQSTSWQCLFTSSVPFPSLPALSYNPTTESVSSIKFTLNSEVKTRLPESTYLTDFCGIWILNLLFEVSYFIAMSVSTSV